MSAVGGCTRENGLGVNFRGQSKIFDCGLSDADSAC
jgi:hypothetical protein